MNLQVLEQTPALVRVMDETGNDYWMKRDKFSRLSETKEKASSLNSENTVAHGLLDIIRGSSKPVFTGYSSPEAFEVLKALRDKGFNISSLGTLSSTASTLRKNGLIVYANGEKNSGWVAA